MRPLTDEGREIMGDVAKGLRRLVGKPDILVSSTLVRAVQTAEIIGREFGIEKFEQTESLVPEASPLEFLKWLEQTAKRKDIKLVCAVGHEPHLSSLVSYFLTGEVRAFIDFKKSGACLLEFPDSDIYERGAILRWHTSPKIFG